jgi:hypothetical protein
MPESDCSIHHIHVLVHHGPVFVFQVEIEFVQERLVNNFRPVQPLNDRTVYRSFKSLKTAAALDRPGQPAYTQVFFTA